jgi:enolase
MMPDRITALRAREILDSRGRPTVEAEVELASGVVARASVPSGASTGALEAHELRDGEAARYEGLGTRKAVAHVCEVIAPAVRGWDPADQAGLDQRLVELDGTPQKQRLGANALLAVSLAVARAAAASAGEPLFQYLARQAGNDRPLQVPLPMTNLISGGKHAGGQLDIQDVLMIPRGAADYPTALEWIVRVYWRLGRLLREAGYEGYLVGDEGGYGPRLATNEQALEMVVRAIEAAGLSPGEEVSLAVDVAASHFFRDGRYVLRAEGRPSWTSDELIDGLARWCRQYPIQVLEDGLSETDWEGWKRLTARLGGQVLLVGDDLFVTSPPRLRQGIAQGVANAVLVKPNQIGTLTETLTTVQLARASGYAWIVSARSGETEDDWLADLAVGVGARHIKIGSVARSERLAKYNRLLRIYEWLGRSAG